MFVLVKPFQPCLTFASKVGAYLSGAPKSKTSFSTLTTLGWAPSLNHKDWTSLQSLVRDGNC